MKELIKPVTAADIVALLASRHLEDVWVPECKNGPSQTSSHLRLDGWAMKKSWASPFTIGYEVKVSRSDFLNDKKWMGYLPLCNELYFVCPSSVIKETEIPESAGLIYVSKAGRGLITKKKAPYRQVEIPESLYRYIIMCRTKITKGYESNGEPAAKVDYWKRWLEEKVESRHIGYNVARGIQDTVEAVRRENKALKDKHAQYDELVAFLQKLGYAQPDKEWITPHVVKGKLDRLNEIIPKNLEFAISSLQSQLTRCQESIEASRQVVLKEDAT